MEIDKSAFIASLGGPAAADSMNAEAKADALEDFMMKGLNEQKFARALNALNTPGGVLEISGEYPTVAEIEAQIETRNYRRGVGNLFLSHEGNVKRLSALPAKPTLADYFKHRFTFTGNHVLQSANLAKKNGLSEEIILACLLHDTVQELIKVDHGWWSAQLYEPYVSEKVAFAIRYHQALRFYEDKAVRLRVSGNLSPVLRRGLQAGALHRSRLPDGSQPQVVFRNAHGDGERSVFVRARRESAA